MKNKELTILKNDKEADEDNEIITEDEIQNEKIRFGDILLSFMEFFKHPIMKYIFRHLLIFILCGYLHKIWLWFSACVINRYEAPCKEEIGLFTMPFIFVSAISSDSWESPHFFSFWDFGHIALSSFFYTLGWISFIIVGKIWEKTKYLFVKLQDLRSNFIRNLKLKSIQRKKRFRKTSTHKKND